MDHLLQRSADRLLPGTPGSSLNGLHSEVCRKARRKTDAEHWGVSSGRDYQRDGSFREAQKRQGVANSAASSGHPPGRRKWAGRQKRGSPNLVIAMVLGPCDQDHRQR